MAVIMQNNGSGAVVVGASTFAELANTQHDHSTYAQGGPLQGFISSGSAIVDFGFDSGGEGDIASTVVAAPWVTANTILVAGVAGVATADHDPDDVAAEAITVYVTDIVPGTSFTVVATAPNETWGKYLIYIRG